jgi:glycosyltransferase involved in cell wall biosynthesis
MKILHLTISGDLVGGGDTIIANILKEKRPEIIEYITTLYFSDFMDNLSRETGVRYWHPRNNKRLILGGRFWAVEIIVRNIPFLIVLAKNVRQESIQIIHAHGFPSALAALIVKFLSGAKIVYTHHFYRSKPSRFERIMLTPIYNLINAKTGVSDAVSNSMNNSFPAVTGKFTTVYNCVASVFFRPDIVTSKLFVKQKEAGKKIFIQAARFHKIKNQIWVARAVNELPEEYRKKVFVVFLGDGEEMSVVKDFVAKNSLDDNFSFMGPIKPADVPVIIAEGDYGLFPSELEGFGLGAVECMAMGLPVIALDNELMREIVGNSGILSQKENLSHALVEMLEKGDSLREVARKRAQLFSSKSMKDGYETIYQKIV